MIIDTKRLKIIQCNQEILSAAIDGTLENKLDIIVPENWTEFGVEALNYSREKLMIAESEQSWWTYFPIYKSENKLIGSGGYMGKPTEDGAVEIGYEIAPDYRNQGLATEFSKALIENAFRHEAVNHIYAHTLGEINPSAKVLEKLGFDKVEELQDPTDGAIWKWKLLKTNDTLS